MVLDGPTQPSVDALADVLALLSMSAEVDLRNLMVGVTGDRAGEGGVEFALGGFVVVTHQLQPTASGSRRLPTC